MTVAVGLTDPLQQEVTSVVADQVLEDPGQVAGTSDVRTGEANLIKMLDVALGQPLPGPHDPAVNLAGAGNGVGWLSEGP